MTYEVQTYDTTDDTVYYDTVEDAMSCEDARDVIAVQGRKTPDELAQGLPKIPQDAL